MTYAHARRIDPQTSHLAAESVKDTTPLQERILSLYETHGAMIDDEMIEAYARQFGHWWPATPSSLRSRRSDLHYAGKVVERGTKLNARGRKSLLWDINDGRLW